MICDCSACFAKLVCGRFVDVAGLIGLRSAAAESLLRNKVCCSGSASAKFDRALDVGGKDEFSLSGKDM